MTVEEQAEIQRAAYRSKCTYRRSKSVIEVKDGDTWRSYQGYSSINEAKRAARSPQFSGRLYAV